MKAKYIGASLLVLTSCVSNSELHTQTSTGPNAPPQYYTSLVFLTPNTASWYFNKKRSRTSYPVTACNPFYNACSIDSISTHYKLDRSAYWQKIDTSSDFAAVSNRCGVPQESTPKPQFAFLIPIALFLIPKVINWLAGQIDNSLQEQVNLYTKTWHGYASTDIYKDMGYVRAGNHTDNTGYKAGQHVTCFDYSRYTYDPHRKHYILVSDFLGRIASYLKDPNASEGHKAVKKMPKGLANLTTSEAQASSHPEIIKVGPVSLYYSNYAAIGRRGYKSNKKQVFIYLTLTSYFLTRESGAEKVVVNKLSLLSPEFTPDDFLRTKHTQNGAKIKKHSSFYETYVSRPHYVTHVYPALPWDSRRGIQYANYTFADLSAIEVDNVPWLLKHASTLFHQNKASLVKSLGDAAKNAVNAAGTR